MRTTLLAISLFAVSACAGGPSVPSTYSSLEVVTEVYDGPLEPRPPAGESLRRIGRQLEQLTAIAANRTRLLEMFEVADGAIRFYDEGVTRELAEISNLPDPEETRRSLPYNPTNIRNIRTILYGSAEPGEGGQRRELQTPHLDQVAPQELAELTGSLAGLAGNIRDGTLEAGDPGQDALAAIEVADAYINNFTTKLLLAWDRARELVAEVRKINPRALSGDPDSIRRLEELKLELASPETAREIASFVFFSNTVLLTSFGRTRVEILDPADPRIRASSGDAELREGVLGDEEAWQTVYGRTFAEGDGTNEFIIVQESPLHYRMKDFQTDPSDVVGLQVSFAESALSILSQVLGAGGAPYGLSALTLLEEDLDLVDTSAVEEASAVAKARASIDAARAIAEQRAKDGREQLQPLRSALLDLAIRAREAQRGLDDYAAELDSLEDRIAVAEAEAEAATLPALEAERSRLEGDREHLILESREVQRTASTLLDSIRAVLDSFSS